MSRRLADPWSRIGTAVGLAWEADRWCLAGLATASLVNGLGPAATAWSTTVVVNRLTDGADDPGTVTRAAVVLAAVGLTVTVLAPVSRYLQAHLDRAVAMTARSRLYEAVDAVPLLSQLEEPAFRDRLRLADEASRSGPSQVVNGLLGVAQTLVTVVSMVAAVLAIFPPVAALLLAATVPALAAEMMLGRTHARMMWEISPAERRELFWSDLLTNLSAAKELRLFGAGRHFRARMLADLRSSSEGRERFDRRELLTQGLLAVLAACLGGLALVWVARSAAEGTVGIGGVAGVLVAVGSLQSALSQAVGHLAIAHGASLLLDHYRALITVPTPTPSPPPVACSPTPSVASPRSGIELVDVWFRYAPDQPWVLRGLDLQLAPGQAVGLVGRNGAGKSTLVKLLCRLYEPTRGCVRWDGVDLRDIPVDQLRRRIAAVFQDFMSYDLTAAENIAVGDVDGAEALDLSPGRLRAAAAQADVADALDALPRGMSTLLSRSFLDHAGDEGLDGVLLSGGQWQRLALARALVRGRRELLILDEPSSGLDVHAEHLVHQRLRAHQAGRTSVLISHRLSTVRHADRIVVLDGGQVAESGAHADLLVRGGIYADMFAMQSAGYRDVVTPA